jgi:glutathione S-transferase/hemerythrin-like domain-containing protein
MTLGTLYSDGPLCPFTHRVLVASRELQAPVEVVYGRNIPADARDANTSGTWPAFVPADGGEMLQDSSDIIEHLIAHSGERGDAYRTDPETLATLDTLIGCIRKVIMAGKPSIQAESREGLDRALAEVEALRAAAPGPFLAGALFSQADAHVAPFLHRLPFLVEIRNHVPGILQDNEDFNAWVDRVVNRKSFQEVAPKRHLLRQLYAQKASYGKPMKVGRLHHSGFRGMWNDLTARVSAVAAGDDRDNEGLQEARDLCYLLFRALSLHAKFENLVLFPALDAATGNPEFTAEGVAQHDHEEGEMNALLERFDRALGAEPGDRAKHLTDLAAACERVKEGQFAHLDFEESTFLPVLAELDVKQHLEMLEGAYEMCILERPHLIGVLASYMPIENTLSLLDSLLYAVETDSDQWRLLLTELHRYLKPEQWLRVVQRYEDELPTSLMFRPSRHGGGSIGSAARALHAAAPVDRIEIPKAPASA